MPKIGGNGIVSLSSVVTSIGPRSTAFSVLVTVIAGQMSASVAFDHFGWLGLPQRSADLPRLAGIVLLVAGVMLIRR